jgi:alkyl hydroperoxide reductase subunit AhpF
MSVMDDKTREAVRKELSDLPRAVKLVMFTQELECEYCAVTRELVEELAGLSDHLTAEVRDFLADAELAAQYGVDKIPALLVLADEDPGIRFFGIPAGYEFDSLLEAIRNVARGDAELPGVVKEDLAKVDKPVHLQVMITPT